MDQPAESPRFRFSIRGVMLVTALCAIAAAPVGWLGGGYALSAGASLLLLGVAARAIARREFAAGIVGCFVAVVASALLFSSGLFLQAVATLVVFLLSLSVPYRVRPLVATCVVVMLLAYVPMFRHAIVSDREIDAMRERWPLVSIRHRLPAMPVDDAVEPVSLSSEQVTSVDLIDKQAGSPFRGIAGQLARIHSDSYKKFARTPGFGLSRMGPVRIDRLDDDASIVRKEPAVSWPMTLSELADSAEPGDLNQATQVVFLDEDRLGYVEAPDRVSGFAGHGFNRLPYDQDRWGREEETVPGVWAIDRLDLIGAVLHDEAVAYVSDKLPNMETLRDAPTRPLEDFESQALEKLRGQEDLIVEEVVAGGETHVRMVGAIRAGNSCATCHEVPYGTLLGAFSYDLTRLNPAQSRPSAGG